MTTISKASRGKIVTGSGFRGYDLCANPYVGCQFGCAYCYTRFFVKDPKPWGEFVRVREHLPARMAKELPLVSGKRVVLGTMTDPYKPAERRYRLTRQTLEFLQQGSPAKVGIFTRSPIVLDDLALIASLPRARVHMTIPLLPHDAQIFMEPISIRAEIRWTAARKIKEAGIALNINVAPSLPVLSDGLVEETAKQLANLEPDEFFVDSMQLYSESWAATTEAMKSYPNFKEVVEIAGNKAQYSKWKENHRKAWMDAWSKVGKQKTLAIWCDHETRVWEDMSTGQPIDQKHYDKVA